MPTTDPVSVDDLEGLLKPFAQRPKEPIWLPISLFTMQDRSVAVCVRPEANGKVLVTDDGETLSLVTEMGLDFDDGSVFARDIAAIASKRGFAFDGHSFERTVTPGEIPTAALHLAEVEIAASALLQVRYLAPLAQVFLKRARSVLSERLRPKVAKFVKYRDQYVGPYKDGQFFCVAEVDRPICVKVVTDSNNMRDAVIAAMMYANEPLELAALRKPRIKLGGPRLIQFTTFYAGHMYEKAEKLADYMNERVG